MFRLIQINNNYNLVNKTLIFCFFLLFVAGSVLQSKFAFSNSKENKASINGSGLMLPRMVSLKNSLTYMRFGPGKQFPVKFELKQKGYPLKVIAEFNNWRKVITVNDISGWIHTQLLSSFKTGLITEKTFLKKTPSNSSRPLAKLLPDLLVNIKKCKEIWCKIEIIKEKTFVGWVKRENIWGAMKN